MPSKSRSDDRRGALYLKFHPVAMEQLGQKGVDALHDRALAAAKHASVGPLVGCAGAVFLSASHRDLTRLHYVRRRPVSQSAQRIKA